MNGRAFVRVPTVQVEQPIGVFYAASIPARKLLEVCYTDRVWAIRYEDSYRLRGSQRRLDEKRLRDIGRFIGTNDSTFPNSVILAANYDREEGASVDEAVRWRIEEVDGGLELVIPTGNPLAPIIDGQHRLFGFSYAPTERLDMPVLCSVFIDLPRPYQAYVFATVNSTQKSVSRSQTFELFGYNLDEEDPAVWSPEKLAVFLARKLNIETGSPFCEHILVAAQADFGMTAASARESGRWMISMATFVDGVTRLVSTSPRRDDEYLRTGKDVTRSHLSRVVRPGSAPLRDLYLEGRDSVLMAAVRNFFDAVFARIGGGLGVDSYLTKTVGMQALFDTLYRLAPEALVERNFSVDWFSARLEGVETVDYSHPAFRTASGQGRTTLRKVILAATRLDENPDEATESLLESVRRQG